MSTSSSDFVTVDMRGLKGPLMALAQARRVSVSVLVRGAVAHELGIPNDDLARHVDRHRGRASGAASVKLSIRMKPDEARRLAAGARGAGLAQGAYLAGLIDNVPVLSAGGDRAKLIATLVASTAELATFSRGVHRLAALLRQGDVESARPYREMLDTLASDVRRHLRSAARGLADLQPQRSSAPSKAQSMP